MNRPGSSMENAIVISIKDHAQVVDAEYDYLESVHGHEGEAWEFRSQAFHPDKQGPCFDLITIVFPDGSSMDTWFDITAFCGDFGMGNDAEKVKS